MVVLSVDDIMLGGVGDTYSIGVQERERLSESINKVFNCILLL